MNQVSEEKKDSLTKTLAILGFVGVIILIVWMAVKVVALIPSAFSSLASIADSVYNRTANTELVVQTENSVVNDGESFTVSWNKMPGNGTYSFAYKCVEGVSLDMRIGTSNIQPVTCNNFVDLAETNEIQVMINTEKQRFTDVEYAVRYLQSGSENITTESVITVVNATIPTTPTATATQPTPANPPRSTATQPTPNGPTTNSPTTPTTPVVAGEPRVIKKYIWQIPESDPHGYVDLEVTFIAVGTIKHDVFYSQPNLEEDEPGAIRFEIKNIGTKTAERWSYDVELPNGDDFESGNQKDLKPNERVVITLGFDGLDEGKEKFSVDVTARGDISSRNNEFERTVRIVD